MKNPYISETDFRQVRPFGDKINATFEFIAKHFQALGKALVYIVLPVALLSGIAMGFFKSEILGNLGSSSAGRYFSQSFAGSYMLAVLGLLTAYVLLSASVYSYVRLCMLGTPQPIAPGQVWAQVRRLLPSMFLYMLGLLLIYIFSLLLFVIPAIYLSVPLSLFFAVYVMEGESFSDTFSRCLQLVKNNWWATFGLMFIMYLIQAFMGIVFHIPQYAAIFARTMHWGVLGSSTAMLVTQSFASIGQVFLYVPLIVALCFQYFHLSELKDGLGMRALVDQLGKAPAVVRNDDYRPDEEGEY